MAANMKAVKLRMKSIQSTMQITKAMELVASSKLAENIGSAARAMMNCALTDMRLVDPDDDHYGIYDGVKGEYGSVEKHRDCVVKDNAVKLGPNLL